jgi:putative aminopeptidase FrvX
VQDIVTNELDLMGILYSIDEYGQIYSAQGTALLSAHMDQVSQRPITKLFKGSSIWKADGNLGADDKNGIYIALAILRKNPHLSFLFSTEEEIGGHPFPSVIKTSPYSLVFDRKGNSDIIGASNNYCSSTFESLIYRLSKKHKYQPTYGVYSDANQLSRMKIPTVNLSVGYYNAHTENEYTNINDLAKALSLGLHLIQSLPSIRHEEWEPRSKKSLWYDREFIMDVTEVRCSICGEREYKSFTEVINGERVCEYCAEYLLKI